jgi:DNA-binding response OmpR family regulator
MSTRILMVDDDTALSAMVAEYLGGAGFVVETRSDAGSGMARLAHVAFDAVILDVMLPDGDGFDLCRRIRAEGDVPVLMLTARGDDTDRIVGLELGADDYLPKPFNPRELLARLRAVLRRRRDTAPAVGGVLCFEELEIDANQRRVRRSGRDTGLTGHQFAVLEALARRPGQVMSREALMNAVSGDSLEAFDRSIDVHISRIRAAIEDNPRRPRRVITVRGAGYMFAPPAPPAGGEKR